MFQLKKRDFQIRNFANRDIKTLFSCVSLHFRCYFEIFLWNIQCIHKICSIFKNQPFLRNYRSKFARNYSEITKNQWILLHLVLSSRLNEYTDWTYALLSSNFKLYKYSSKHNIPLHTQVISLTVWFLSSCNRIDTGKGHNSPIRA